MPRLALVGDRDPAKTAHLAIPQALEQARQRTGVALEWMWLGSDTIREAPRQLAEFAGVWCVPGSPYRSLEGALAAIRFARETGRPFLGTCGGFQHALIEFARDGLGLAAADHAETNATAADLVITPLSCSLVGQQGDITFTPGSQLHRIFGEQPSCEGYHCNYGPNPAYRTRFEDAGLRFTGFDAHGQIRAFELPGHPFFIGTLFQPERAVLAGKDHPLIEALVRAANEAA